MSALRPRWPLLAGLLLAAFLLQGLAWSLPASADRGSNSLRSYLAEIPVAQLPAAESGGEAICPAGLWAAAAGRKEFRRLFRDAWLRRPQRKPGPAPQRFGSGAPTSPRPPPGA